MNEDTGIYIYMHVKKRGLNGISERSIQSLIFYVKLGEKINTNVNHARGNLPTDPILCKLSLTGENVPNFNDGAKCLIIFQIKKIFI